MKMRKMGLGAIGGSNLIFKRQFRWTFTVTELCNNGKIPESFVKVASRPNLTIEDTEINFLNAKTWIPGKASWETITVTYYDVATIDNKPLWNWLASIYNFADKNGNVTQASKKKDYAGVGTLVMYDGCGTPLEQWTLSDLWPSAVNFGELDYSSSEESTIELTLRFSNVDYQSLCPNYRPVSCCNSCDGKP